MADNNLNIGSFSDDEGYQVEDFQDSDSVGMAPPPATNIPSNRNQAATVALLNSNDPVQQMATYQNVNAELVNHGNSPTMQDITEEITSNEQAAMQRTTAQYLANPAISDEWKANAIQAVNDRSNPMYNPRTMLATKEATQPAPNSTAESADLRELYAQGVGEAMAYQREKQKVYNATKAKESGLANAVDVGESFLPLVAGAKQAGVERAVNGGGWNALKAFILPGSSRADMAEKFNSLPIDQRQAALQGLADKINGEGKTALLPDSIDQTNYEGLQQVIENGSYTVSDKYVDNVMGLLDIVGIGSLIKGTFKAAAEGATALKGLDTAEGLAEATARSWERRTIASDIQPVSPSQTIKDANPAKARELHALTEADETGDVAEALYGTSRTDAIAGDLAPQPGSVTGGVQSKVHRPEIASDNANIADPDIVNMVTNTASPHISQREKQALAANVSNDFFNATGMASRKEMSSIAESVDGGLSIKAVYGPTDSGWSSVGDAVNQAQYALRKYGVDENEISILMRQGEEYVPISKEAQASLLAGNNAQIKGDYLLQINHRYEYTSADIQASQFEKFGVSSVFNFMNRFEFANGKTGNGSLTSQIVDPASMFSPEFLKGAVIGDVAGDAVSAKLMKTAKPFVDTMKKVPADRHFAMERRIKEANLKGQALSETTLKAEGWSAQEIAGFLSFRKTQDTLWEVTNADLVKSYKNRGYGKLTHKESGFDVVARPVSRNQVSDGIRAYDPVKDEVRTLSRAELDEMYAGNKSIAETADVMDVDGLKVQYVINHNSAEAGYIRSLSAGEPIMAYRHGYYAVRYKDPHFIERKLVDEMGTPLRDSHGNEVWKAVATAPDIPSAEKALARYNSTSPGEYRRRNDLKGEEYEAANTQLHTAGGLSAQRIRGKRLEDATGSNMELDAVHIESPGESMMNSINAISSRVSYRDWLETSKQRLMATYKDVMPVRQGRPDYPTRVDEIKGTSKEAADARAMFEYIRAMENGYTNLIDDGYKAIANSVADMAGTRGFGKMERFAREFSEASVTNKIKMVPFTLMIALSPLRQLVLQTSQIAMLAGRFPAYIPHLIGDNLLLITHNLMGGNVPEAVLKTFGRDKYYWDKMMKSMDESGITKGVGKHDLARGIIDSTADSSIRSMNAARSSLLGKVAKAPVTAGRAIVNTSRKIGFDAGEYMVQASSFMAHYHDTAKAGKVLTKGQLDDVIHMARNFTGNFGKSGSLAMNQNSASVFTQYLQVPVKIAQLVLTNKAIPLKSRLVMASTTAIMFGIGTEDIYNMFSDELPKDKFARDVVVDGLLSASVNGIISAFTDKPTNIDVSGLNPVNAYGVVEFLQKVGSGGFTKLVTESPAGSIVFGNNPRITNLVKTMGNMVGYGDVADELRPQLWGRLWKDVINLSSGTSNGYKAMLALKYRKEYAANGRVLRDDVSTPEALAMLMGFGGQEGKANWKVIEDMAGKYKARKEDVLEIFNQNSRMLIGTTGGDELAYQVKMGQLAMSLFKDDPQGAEWYMDALREQVSNSDDRLLKQIMAASRWATMEDVHHWLDTVPNITDEQRANYRAWADMAYKAPSEAKDK
ncbi:hypothetical protein DMS60_18900 [Klebsiella variicola]|uniref:hypothetical protein n=1 Tax=Klebsiella variicola TaxID=244366 RepID=UPI000D74CDC0|nr:hypothetical protein [Klebsiella variicola]PXL36576.1 hypothetical protein DMS60_18900 [Klebsiella variicola]